MGFRFVVIASAGATCEHGHHRKGPGQAVTPGLETAVHGVIPLPVARVLHALKQPVLIIGLLVFYRSGEDTGRRFRDLKPP
ncbi:hypothetical protein D3C85_1452180 [compost metagenome]